MCIQKSENPVSVAQCIFRNIHITNLGIKKTQKTKHSQHPRSPFMYYTVTSHLTLHRNCYQAFLDHRLVLLISEFKWNQYSMHSFVFSFFLNPLSSA